MPSASDIASQITQGLLVTEPNLDTSIGTPLRKVIDQFSSQLSSAYVNQYFINNQYDISSLTGTSLDDFVNEFGFTRFPATRASGVVTFTTPSPATQAISIQAGTTVSTNSSPVVKFTVITTSTLSLGSVSVDVPVVATVAGSTGNVEANQINAITTPLNGITAVTNTSATSGGNDAESDQSLINRFKNTVFRNLAGTVSQYLGTALENPNTTAANVIGAYKVWDEQLQVINGTGQSEVQSAKYIYDQNYVFGPSISGGDLLTPNVNYTINPNTYALSAPSTSSPDNFAVSSVTNATATYTGTRYYRIAWGNETGISSASSSVSVDIASAGSAAELTWVARAGAQWVYIYEGSVSGSETLVAIVPATASGWNDEGISSAAISNITQSNPSTVTTSSPHGLVTGEQATISGVEGATQANGNWTVTVINATNFQITANVTSAYTSGGSVGPTSYGQAQPSTNTSGYAPTVTSIDAKNFPDGIYEFQFDYTPICSRNDPANGVINKVDIYVAGNDIQQATQTIPFTTNIAFNNSTTSPYYVQNFKRPDGSNPVSGNYFIPLGFTPVTELPSQISIASSGGTPVTSSSYQTIGGILVSTDQGQASDVGAQTYYLGVDYWLVNDITAQGGTAHSYSGIEFTTSPVSAPALPPANSLINLSYDYNALPSEIETALQGWRMITSDVWVHQAILIYFVVNLVVVLGSGSTISSVQSLVESAIQAVFNSIGFDGIVSTSAILSAVGPVPGIQSVRFATSADDASNYAIQEFTSAGALVETYSTNSGTVGSISRATDIRLNDDTLPVLNGVNLILRAANTFQNGA